MNPATGILLDPYVYKQAVTRPTGCEGLQVFSEGRTESITHVFCPLFLLLWYFCVGMYVRSSVCVLPI